MCKREREATACKAGVGGWESQFSSLAYTSQGTHGNPGLFFGPSIAFTVLLPLLGASMGWARPGGVNCDRGGRAANSVVWGLVGKCGAGMVGKHWGDGCGSA